MYLFCYDFPSTPNGNKRRNQIVKYLKGHGIRVQYSVFETRFKNNEELEFSLKKMEKMLNLKEDSLRIYPFNELSEREIRILGEGKVFEREDHYIF